MRRPTPSSTPDPNHPVYFLALAVGSISFVVGAVCALLLYTLGGPDIAVLGVALGVVMFAISFSAILRLRDGVEP